LGTATGQAPCRDEERSHDHEDSAAHRLTACNIHASYSAWRNIGMGDSSKWRISSTNMRGAANSGRERPIQNGFEYEIVRPAIFHIDTEGEGTS
jgi:hypothetical protein